MKNDDPAFIGWIMKHESELFSSRSIEHGGVMDLMMGTTQYPRDDTRPSAYAYTRPVRVSEPVIHGLIELTSKCDGPLLRKLIRGAYTASSRGHIVLALNRISTREVDLHLLPALQANGARREDISYRPVRYVDHDLLAQAAKAEFVIAHSSALSAALLSRGVRYMNAAAGLRYLEAVAASAPEGVPEARIAI